MQLSITIPGRRTRLSAASIAAIGQGASPANELRQQMG
jgi:hypothetical protein